MVGGERGIQEEEGGGQDEEGERSNTLSSPVHTLVVTSTGKVLLAFVKVHRRLSGSSAPLVRPEPASSREKKPPKSPEPKIYWLLRREPLFLSLFLCFSFSQSLDHDRDSLSKDR